MEILNIISEHIEVFIILMGILVLNFFCIIYLIIKERKEDKKEINELLDDLNISDKPNTKNEKEQDQKIEQNKKEVEEMLIKMQKDLEAKPEDVVTNFENEQEEKSIISYQELLESVKNNDTIKVTPVKIEEEPEKIEVDNFKEIDEPENIEIDNYGFSEEPIHIDVKEPETIEIKELDDTTSSDKKFKGTDFISPIFGRQENNFNYPTVPKLHSTIMKEEFVKPSTLDLDATRRLDEEIKKNDDFLKALKDFRKSLD